MTTLDELRRANLQEQKRAQAAPPKPVQPVAESQPAPASEFEALALATTSGEPVETVRPVDKPAAHGAEKGNGKSAKAAPVVTAEFGDEQDPYTRKGRGILDRFYRGLSRKVIHPTGVKATVDMPPELFWRVKRYCHDHNNVTVRQLFLDLVTALLDEEGY